MKNLNYEAPSITLINADVSDIITSSPGIESPIRTDGDAIWDLDINH